MYQTPDGNKRMVRVASTTVDLMAPKDVLSDQGDDTPWYFATGTWDPIKNKDIEYIINLIYSIYSKSER